jgi:hypothetical protein
MLLLMSNTQASCLLCQANVITNHTMAAADCAQFQEVSSVDTK